MGRGTGTKFFILLWKNLIIKVGETKLTLTLIITFYPEAALADVNTGGDFESLYFLFILFILPPHLTHHKLYFLSIFFYQLVFMNAKVLVPTILFVAIVALRTEGGDRLNPKFVSSSSSSFILIVTIIFIIHRHCHHHHHHRGTSHGGW